MFDDVPVSTAALETPVEPPPARFLCAVWAVGIDFTCAASLELFSARSPSLKRSRVLLFVRRRDVGPNGYVCGQSEKIPGASLDTLCLVGGGGGRQMFSKMSGTHAFSLGVAADAPSRK